MRERRLVEDGSVCEGDFIDGVDTVVALKQNWDKKEKCRFFPHNCPALNNRGPFCIIRTGHEVARFALKYGRTIDDEMRQFSEEAFMPVNGYFDPREQEPEDGTTDRDEVVQRVRQAATQILGIQEVDANSINKEYKERPSDRLAADYPILNESLFDETSSIWIHLCGSTIVAAEVIHPVWYKLTPFAGPGRTVVKQVPYCPSCSEEPNRSGPAVYVEDEEAEEIEKLRRLRGMI